MIAMKASEIASVVQGTLHGDDVTVTEAAIINSSDATPGSLFLAIKGERVDGHDFVADARSHGAVLTLATKSVEGPHIVVADVVVVVVEVTKLEEDDDVVEVEVEDAVVEVVEDATAANLSVIN
mgnify:CR=1 FL=1